MISSQYFPVVMNFAYLRFFYARRDHFTAMMFALFLALKDP